MKKNILLVEDEDRMREILTDYFTNDGFNVIQGENGQRALELFDPNTIDLVILDIMMPKLDGWTVCRRIRKISRVPIIIVTARSDEDDQLMGFDFGADEYVTKPFSPRVLIARAKTLLKRAAGTIGAEDGIIVAEGIEISKLSRTVKIDGCFIELAHKEFELLLYLIENKGFVLSRETILKNVWGYDYYGDLRTVDTHIKKLRSKLGEKARLITTIIRSGYKFEVRR